MCFRTCFELNVTNSNYKVKSVKMRIDTSGDQREGDVGETEVANSKQRLTPRTLNELERRKQIIKQIEKELTNARKKQKGEWHFCLRCMKPCQRVVA